MTRLLIYAGPNGSGKSSLREVQSEPADQVIDADQIARVINPTNPRGADREAGRRALLLFQSAIAARRTISLETTLAGHSILRRLAAAKTAGYTLELRYIALDLVDLNIQRVQARAALGGHPIAPADIRRRHARSLANLPQALAFVRRAILTDNTGPAPRPVLEWCDDRIVHAAPDLPNWALQLLPRLLSRRQAN